MEKKRGTRGITLIALIITIIVMLILVAVTIQVTISGGIFSKAGEAVGKTKEAEKNELNMINDMVNKIDNINSKPNAPEVMEGMIAVTWDENQKSWVKADKDTDDWYEYGTTQSTKKWANVVTVKKDGTKGAEGETLIAGSKTRGQYQEAEAGTPILQEDILGMFVWIPRYAYKIPQENYHTSDAGIIDIKFLSGTSGIEDMIDGVEYNETTTNNFTQFPDGYVVHPAFSVGTGEMNESGEEKIELTGIWVAKFEASSDKTSKDNPNLGTNYGSSKGEEYLKIEDSSAPTNSADSDQVTIRPNVTSWRNINVKNCYIACTNMVKEGNIHGLTSSTDSHLIKNVEWGAVAYLAQSRYGNPQGSDSSSGIWSNSYFEGDGKDANSPYYTTRTGMVGKSRDDYTGKISIKSIDGITEENGVVTINYQNNGTKTFYTYNTEQGIHGSTTGTVYGIYDMAGGAWEFQAFYAQVEENEYVNFFENDDRVIKQHIAKCMLADVEPENQMTQSYLLNKGLYGNGIWEVSSNNCGKYAWNGCYLWCFSLSAFSVAGAAFTDGSSTGLFYIAQDRGDGTAYRTFRPVLWVK